MVFRTSMAVSRLDDWDVPDFRIARAVHERMSGLRGIPIEWRYRADRFTIRNGEDIECVTMRCLDDLSPSLITLLMMENTVIDKVRNPGWWFSVLHGDDPRSMWSKHDGSDHWSEGSLLDEMALWASHDIEWLLVRLAMEAVA